MARIAKSLDVLRTTFNRLYPNRSKLSDGWLGDSAHAARKSDHNPNSAGVVLALDITHDPKHGVDTYHIADLMKDIRDPRIDYVISNRRIFSSTVDPWTWRPYTGTNPHNKHMHVSVKKDQKHYDDVGAWNLGGVNPSVPDMPEVVAVPILKRGDHGPDVQKLQGLLNLPTDGIFGPKTEAAVRAFQKANKLEVDGQVGSYTWDVLGQPKTPQGVAKTYPQQAMDILMDELGYSKEQAAGVVGNMQQESYMDLRPAVVGDKGTAFGILQWRGARFDMLKEFAQNRGKTWDDFETQVLFVNYELRQPGWLTWVWKALQNAKTVEAATEAVISYCRPRGWSLANPKNGDGWNNRLKNAEKMFKETM